LLAYFFDSKVQSVEPTAGNEAMRSKVGLAVVLAGMLSTVAPSVARADRVGGNDLFKFCSANPDLTCLAYTVAIADALSAPNVINGYRACIPLSVTNGQVRDVVLLYMKQHPEKRHYGAAGLVAGALAEAFPCP
jgi:Rap1a immunity proteins